MYKLMFIIAALGLGSMALAGDEAKKEAFNELDSNKDGMLSQQEASVDRDVITKFTHIDANRDGYVSAAEYQEYITKDEGDKEEAE